MSFLQRAKEAAEGAAEQAKKAAGEAAVGAGHVASQASRSAADPATHEKLGKQAREAVGLARRGASTIVERIDPGTLAEVIIKATALQEATNKSLRKKRSPYRIAEVVISATIPPGVSFSIARTQDMDDELQAGDVSSADLVEALDETGEAVVSLDGTKFDEAEIAAAREELSKPE